MMLRDGAVNRIIFQAYVDRVPVPTPEPGDIVVMDNLPAQKAGGIRKAIEQVVVLRSLVRVAEQRVARPPSSAHP